MAPMIDPALFSATGAASDAPVPPADATALAARVATLTGFTLYPQSLVLSGGALFGMTQEAAAKRLLILAEDGDAAAHFAGATQTLDDDGQSLTLLLCALDAANAAALRARLPYAKPRLLGLATSAGCGDRLGLATPGHIRALRGTGIAPILAQQSMRENARTGRTPQAVIDDATWGVFQEGWREGYGADADHLMTIAHIDECVAAGYTFFTVDPGAHVNNEAHHAAPARLAEIYAALPWDGLEISPEELRARYEDRAFVIDEALTLTFDE